jgi:hypothetical protein
MGQWAYNLVSTSQPPQRCVGIGCAAASAFLCVDIPIVLKDLRYLTGYGSAKEGVSTWGNISNVIQQP